MEHQDAVEPEVMAAPPDDAVPEDGGNAESGHGFIGIGRLRLITILQERAEELGIKQVFETQVENSDNYENYDLIVASDGINSKIRTQHEAHFQPEINLRRNKFIWLGTHKLFEAFTFIFIKTKHD